VGVFFIFFIFLQGTNSLASSKNQAICLIRAVNSIKKSIKLEALPYPDGIQSLVEKINLKFSEGTNIIQVALYGLPNSGKTHIGQELKAFFDPHKVIVYPHSGGLIKESFKYAYDEAVRLADGKNLLIIYHQPVGRFKGYATSDEPDFLSKELLGKSIDLSIYMTKDGRVTGGVFDPESRKLNLTTDTYDLIIYNKNAKEK